MDAGAQGTHNKAGMTAFLRQPLQQVGKSQA